MRWRGLILLVAVIVVLGLGALWGGCSRSRSSAEISRAPSSSEASKGGLPQGQDQSGGDTSGQYQLTDRMIVYNTVIALSVENVGLAMSAVRGLAEGVGGFVAGTSSRYQNDKEYASITLRVPASAYNQMMDSLRKLAVKVISEDGTARDVTEEFTDLAAQLRNLEATEAQYLELLKRANTIDEILKVQGKLTEVRGQIERIKGRMNLLQRTSDMATIVVNLSPSGPAKAKGQGWDPAQSAQEAWEQSLAIVQKLADVGIRVIVFSWWLVLPVLVAWGVWALVHQSRRRPADA